MSPANLDDFRRNLTAAQAIVTVAAIAVEGTGQDIPQEALWRTLHAASDIIGNCVAEFDSDAFEAAWRGKAVRL